MEVRDGKALGAGLPQGTKPAELSAIALRILKQSVSCDLSRRL
jgi:hypothetical protein